MAEELLVEVPEELAPYLEGEGVEEVEDLRDTGPAGVAGVVVDGINLGASIVTFVMIRSSVTRFVGRLADAVSRRAKAEGTAVKVDVVVRRGEAETRLRLEFEREGGPQPDLGAIEAAISAAFDTEDFDTEDR
ncbi:hypothetical protein Pth03_60640 [Planotetraspora thailandica]|uniref:Uncharacterized protein n=1 Tax=Planotetraspora thailandica TaxID=487172 RepID=A0A8J3VFN6_9ACTN|nr:hypothetical protein [Planotetraspora thailandica]GII57675.1 hypothetical protein Pth03_60640 [Planotetraspora thailandica]